MYDGVVIGAGMAGLLAAIRLQQRGRSFVVLERSSDVGGTWSSNTYPGCACDVPSVLYSYSFEPNPDWTRVYPQQAEILAYFQRIARKYRLTPHIRLATEAMRALYDESEGCWRVETRGGADFRGRTLIFGTGQLSRPLIPRIEGVERYAGKVFHSAQWDHGYELAGKRVAVIGNGPSAAQFIPEIAPKVAHLVVLQRTPNWILERPDRPYRPWERWLFRRLKASAKAVRALIYMRHETLFKGFRRGSLAARLLTARLRGFMEGQLPDPALRAKLVPDYPVGCKRIMVTNDFLPTFGRKNVFLETDPIARVTNDAIVTRGGREHRVDAIIYGTGFEATDFLAPIEVIGRDGTPLEQAWRDGAEAYLGANVAGFPNMFILYGPNTNLGHNSIIFMVERQVEHVMRLIDALFARRARGIEVRREVMRRYNESLQQALDASVWRAGCRSWYQTAAGKVTTNWPHSCGAWARRLRRTRLEDFELQA
jgi:cation diffusion facilitator CzcD-associated flavoprotein CzcO